MTYNVFGGTLNFAHSINLVVWLDIGTGQCSTIQKTFVLCSL